MTHKLIDIDLADHPTGTEHEQRHRNAQRAGVRPVYVGPERRLNIVDAIRAAMTPEAKAERERCTPIRIGSDMWEGPPLDCKFVFDPPRTGLRDSDDWQ